MIEIPAVDCGRAAAMLCHLATGDQAGYEQVGAEAIADGRLHGLLGALMFLIDTNFGEQLREPEAIQGLRELALRCDKDWNDEANEERNDNDAN